MGLKILLIDDEECIRDSLSIYLEDCGHEVVALKDPTLCPTFNGCCCPEDEPCADVVLIDQNMPGCTGSQFLKKQFNLGCKAPISHKIVMSGNVTQELCDLARLLGFRILHKPFRFDELDRLLEELGPGRTGGAGQGGSPRGQTPAS